MKYILWFNSAFAVVGFLLFISGVNPVDITDGFDSTKTHSISTMSAGLYILCIAIGNIIIAIYKSMR